MAITANPIPSVIGVAPEGMRVWRYHYNDADTQENHVRYAVARRCPHVNAELTWFDTPEAALMAHAMKPPEPEYEFGLARVKRERANIPYVPIWSTSL